MNMDGARIDPIFYRSKSDLCPDRITRHQDMILDGSNYRENAVCIRDAQALHFEVHLTRVRNINANGRICTKAYEVRIDRR